MRFDEIYTTNTYLYFASNIWVPSFSRCRLTNDSWKKQTFFSFCEINATKFGSKNEILHTIVYHYMTSYSYIIMIIVDSCMNWFHFDCIMQLKKSYPIATNVCSRKSVTTFGDLPDWLVSPQTAPLFIISQPRYQHNIDALVPDCSNSIAIAFGYCSLALSHQYDVSMQTPPYCRIIFSRLMI